MSIAEILYVWAKVVNWREARRKRKSMTQQYDTVDQDFTYFRPLDASKDLARIKKLEVCMFAIALLLLCRLHDRLQPVLRQVVYCEVLCGYSCLRLVTSWPVWSCSISTLIYRRLGTLRMKQLRHRPLTSGPPKASQLEDSA